MEKLKEFFNKSFGVIQNLLFHEYQSADPCIFYLSELHKVRKMGCISPNELR